MRLAYDRDGRAGPRRVVKLKPERDVKREATEPQPKEQRWTCGPERVDQGGAPLGRVSPPQSSLVHRRHLETSLSRVPLCGGSGPYGSHPNMQIIASAMGFFGQVAFFGQPAKCEVAHTSFRLAPLKSGMAI